MVRSKEPSKKKQPKDPLLTPPSKPRGGGFLDEGRPWNHGGAAMSPAPVAVPSYMRGTSSSDAKAGRRGRPAASVSASASPARWTPAASVSASASPARRRPAVRVLTKGKVLFAEEEAPGSGLGRATCSSTMKDTKFPDALDLAPGATDAEGPAALRVCPYTYCSLNGHVHAPAVPLRSFLASRRRLIKTQQSMKLKGVSAFRKKSGEKTSGGSGGGGAKIAPLIDEEAVGDFFVEVYGGPRVSSDMSCSDMSLDEMDATVRRMEFVVFDRCGADEDGEKGKDLAVCDDGKPVPRPVLKEKHGAFRDSLSDCSGAHTGSDFVEELPWLRYHGYEYDDSLDDEILEEQRIREEEVVEAEFSLDQEEEQGTSGRSSDEYKEGAAEGQEENDEENTSNLVRDQEILADQGVACRVEACEELDGTDDDNILEASVEQGTAEEKLSDDIYKSEIPDQEVTARAGVTLEGQRIREEEVVGAESSAEQEEEQGTSGRSSDEYKEGAADEENTSKLVSDQEILADEGVACRVEACEELDGRDDENIMEASVEQGTAEEKLSNDIYKSKIPDQEVTARAGSTLEDSFREDISSDQEANDDDEEDECHVESDGESEVTGEQDLEDQQSMPHDGSEMEISEDTISGDGRKEDFSEEVTSAAVLPDDVFEQYDKTVDDVLEQDSSPANAQMELGNPTSKKVDAFEETAIVQQINQDSNVDTQKKSEITAFILEESGIAQQSNPDGGKMEPEVTVCKLKDASEESGACPESNLHDNTEYVTDDAEMGQEITRCKLEDASKETGIDQETLEDDSSACVIVDDRNNLEINNCKSEDVSKESVTILEADHSDNSANFSNDVQGTAEDHDSCLHDDAQNDIQITGCKSEDTCKEFDTMKDTDQSDSSANVRSDAEETVEDGGSVCVSDDAQNGLKISKCNLEDASKEPSTVQEADRSDSSANASADAQNGSELTTSELADKENESKLFTCNSEDVFEESIIGQEADHDGSSVYLSYGAQNEYEVTTCHSEGAQLESDVIQEDEDEDKTAGAEKKLESAACESGGASLKPAMHQEAAGDINTTDASKAIHVTEETNQSFNVQMPAEFTDAKEPSIDDICGAFNGMNLKGDVYFDPAESATCPRSKLIISRRRRTPEEEEYLRGFNPRAPNFLPLELDPDAEKVDLKHQMMDERKNAEEWMIDYALRRALTNLAPARKKKVELLVQAFETVLPHDEDDKKNISPSRPIQPCN
ncbi:calmodulin binding protein PICBP-like [Miscanthus floridulus]|uniref:calmodulin binding protein PICBP-like n=1 Tax=Miscanthus floridulus TaxID=154761 RepID=UPI003459B3F7